MTPSDSIKNQCLLIDKWHASILSHDSLQESSIGSKPELEGSTTKYLQDKLSDPEETTQDSQATVPSIVTIKDGSSGSEAETEDSDGDKKKAEVVKSKLKTKAKVRKEPKYVRLADFASSDSKNSKKKPHKKPGVKEKDDSSVVYVKIDQQSLAKKAISAPTMGTRSRHIHVYRIEHAICT